jgi:hypothetical protein
MPNLEKLDVRWNHHMVHSTWLEDLRQRGCLVYI